MSLRELPVPQPGNHEVLIRVMMTGVCRTDVEIAQHKNTGTRPEPLILGHEFAGIIEEIGSGASYLSRGQRVAVCPLIPCRACLVCSSGQWLSCPNSTMLGVDHHGSFAEYIVVPASSVYHLPDSMEFKIGAYSEPVAASMSILHSGITKEEKGFIYGNNRIAKLTYRILKLAGFTCTTVYDPEVDKKSIARDSVDFIIESQVDTELISEFLKALRYRGRLIIKSRCSGLVGVDFSAMIKKEISFRAVNYGDFGEALCLLGRGNLRVDDLMGEVYPLEHFKEVFALSAGSECKKSFFVPE